MKKNISWSKPITILVISALIFPVCAGQMSNLCGSDIAPACLNRSDPGVGPGDNRPPPGYSFTITLDQSSGEAVVTSSEQGEVRFTGNVTAQAPNLHGIQISLTSSVDAGWASNIEPNSFTASSNELRPITVDVSVPQATPSNIVGNLGVSGKATAGGLILSAEDSATVTVAPYYRIFFDIESQNRTIAPGGELMIPAKVWNVGNAIDTVQVDVENRQELEGKGWKFDIQPSMLTGIHPNEYMVTKVSINAPASYAPSQNEERIIILKATSQGSAGNGTVFRVKVIVQGTSPPGISLLLVVLMVPIAIGLWLLRRRRKRKALSKETIPPDMEPGQDQDQK